MPRKHKAVPITPILRSLPMHLQLRVVGRRQEPVTTGTMMPGQSPSETVTCLLVESVDVEGKVIPIKVGVGVNGQNVIVIPTSEIIEESELPKGTVLDCTPVA